VKRSAWSASPSPTPTSARPWTGPDISDEEHEVVLHEERPVVTKATVPKERVRLDTESATEDRQVTESVRKERIETEGDVPRNR